MYRPASSCSASISIHALHEESDSSAMSRSQTARISIHALHEESDPAIREHVMEDVDFNPRSP